MQLSGAGRAAPRTVSDELISPFARTLLALIVITAPALGGVLELAADGNTPFGRMLDLVMLGDYVSLYMAIARGVDPGPVDMIARLKLRLAETGYGRTPDPV